MKLAQMAATQVSKPEKRKRRTTATGTADFKAETISAPEPQPQPEPEDYPSHWPVGPGIRPEPEPVVESREPVIPVDEISVPIDRMSDTQDVVEWALSSTSADQVEVIGAWVWLTYQSKPSRYELNMLKAGGFRWARKRKQWAHMCGVAAARGGSAHPRTKYGSVVVRDREDD